MVFDKSDQSDMAEAEPNLDERVQRAFDQLKAPDRLGLPKYRRLEQVIIECIRSGYWSLGDRLPAEEQLTNLTPYSLGTVQRAMRQLTSDGLIERRHGDGSYVRARMKEMDDPWHCRFIDTENDSILPISSRALRREEAEPGPWDRYFDPKRRIIRLDRQIMVNNEFLIFSRFFFDNEALDFMRTEPLEALNGTNFRKLINERTRLPITDIDRQITLVDFDIDLRKTLGVTDPTGMRLQAIARSGRHITVFYQEFFIPRTNRPLALPDQE